MTPGTLNTILNTAPLILQGAGKLIRMIRDQKEPEPDNDQPVTLEGLDTKLEKIEQRLDANDESNVEQIKLIEELAKQNEALAESQKRIYVRLRVLGFVAMVAIVLGITGVLLVLI